MNDTLGERSRGICNTATGDAATGANAEPSSPFRRLVSDADWQRLPSAVQRRFARRLEPGESAAFLGEVATTRLTVFGR